MILLATSMTRLRGAGRRGTFLLPLVPLLLGFAQLREGRMLIVHVHVHARPEFVEAFIAATRENALASRQEAGLVRFDVVQETGDPTRFVLIEIYRTEEDPSRHKATPHYAKWRDAVEGMMAEARRSMKYRAVDPQTRSWEYPSRDLPTASA